MCLAKEFQSLDSTAKRKDYLVVVERMHHDCQKFYKDGFALVIGLQATHDNNVHSTQSGTLMEITKRATTPDVNCQVFIISDGLCNFINRDLESIAY